MKYDHFSYQETLMQHHKANLENIGEANKMAIQVVNAIADMQIQFVQEAFHDVQEIFSDFMAAFQKGEMPQNGLRAMQKMSSRSVDHSMNMVSTFEKTAKETYDKAQKSWEDFLKNPKKNSEH